MQQVHGWSLAALAAVALAVTQARAQDPVTVTRLVDEEDSSCDDELISDPVGTVDDFLPSGIKTDFASALTMSALVSVAGTDAAVITASRALSEVLTVSSPAVALPTSNSQPQCDTVFLDDNQRLSRIFCNASAGGQNLPTSQTDITFTDCINICTTNDTCIAAIFDNSTTGIPSSAGSCILKGSSTTNDRRRQNAVPLIWQEDSYVAYRVVDPDAPLPNNPVNPTAPVSFAASTSAVVLSFFVEPKSGLSTSRSETGGKPLSTAAISGVSTSTLTPSREAIFQVPSALAGVQTDGASPAIAVRISRISRPPTTSAPSTSTSTPPGFVEPGSESRAEAAGVAVQRITPVVVTRASRTPASSKSSTSSTLSVSTTSLPTSTMSSSSSSVSSTTRIQISTVSTSRSSTSPNSAATSITTLQTFTVPTTRPSTSVTSSAVTPPSSMPSPSVDTRSARMTSTQTTSSSATPSSTAIAPRLSNPTLLGTNEDESEYGIALPFIMSLYTQSATDITVTTNGVLSLGDSSMVIEAYSDGSQSPSDLPWYSLVPGSAAVWWQYLESFSAPGLGVYYQLDRDNTFLSVEWLMYDNNGALSNVILTYDANEPGNVTYYYFTKGDGGDNSVVGVQGLDTNNDYTGVAYDVGTARTIVAGLKLSFVTDSESVDSGTYTRTIFSTTCFPQGSFPEGICGTQAT